MARANLKGGRELADEVENDEADLCRERGLEHHAEEVLLLRERQWRLGGGELPLARRGPRGAVSTARV